MDMIDLTRKTFGVLTVQRRVGVHRNREVIWEVKCQCGKVYKLRGSKIRRPVERCFHDPVSKKPEYSSWEKMIERCYNKNHDKYANYGGRGIAVCARWRASFRDFLADMGQKPTPQHTIDRKDGNGNYEPNNCRWATKSEQRRNSRDNVYVEHNGKRVLLVDLTEQLGLSRDIVYGRLKNGWNLADALTVPVRSYSKGG
jgi:hypothetical protein